MRGLTVSRPSCLGRALRRLWASLNYRYCMVEARLATERHEILLAVEWARQAGDWNDVWMDQN